MARPSQCPACLCYSICTMPNDPLCDERATESRDSVPNRVVPQSFIDHVELELDAVIETLKTGGPGKLSLEQLIMYMYDKRGMIDDTEHRRTLSTMVAILIRRAAFPNGQ